MKRLDPLTSIRFFAAFWVVLFHLRGVLGPALPEPIANLISRGPAGVNLFFVLSGFVLAYNYFGKHQAGEFDSTGFFVARFARLYPIFFFALIVSLPKYLTEVRQDHPGLLPASAASHLTLMHAWFPPIGGSWVGPSWSISTEFCFYLAFPLLLLLVAKLSKNGLVLLACLALALTIHFPLLLHLGMLDGIQLGWLGYGMDHHTALVKVVAWWPIIRVPEFLLGVILGRLFLEPASQPRWLQGKGLATLATLSVLTIAAFGVSGDVLPSMIMDQSVFTLPFGLLILWLAQADGPLHRLLSWKPLVLLGEASYSLYLLHIGVIYVGLSVLHRFLAIDEQSVAANLLVALFAIVVSLIAYRLIEVPSRRAIVGAYLNRKQRKLDEQAPMRP